MTLDRTASHPSPANDERPRYPRFAISADNNAVFRYDDNGTPITGRGMFVRIEADESTNITVLPPQDCQPPDVTEANYALAIESIRGWCRGRPFEVTGPVPTFADLIAANGEPVIVNVTEQW